MPDAAFLVDGVMEQRIIARLCPNRPVRRIECNGHDVALEAIVERLDLHIRNMSNRYHPIIILIDRETRRDSCEEIVAGLRTLLNAKGHGDQCIIGVVDRCIENWILADWENAIKKLQIEARPLEGECEGVQGKSVLKRLLPDDILYHEPTWGKDLFLACDAANIYAKSPSFRNFVDQLQLPCHWLGEVEDRFRPPPHE
jgi:hypothetical protein